MEVKKILFLSLLISACSNSGSSSAPVKTFDKNNTLECTNNQINGEYIVLWKTGQVSVEKAVDDESFQENFLKQNEGFVYTSEPNYALSSPVITPTPVASPSEWGGDVNWGVNDTHADKVWTENVRGDGVIVAVIDTGLDLEHAAIKEALFVNQKEIAGNNEDDDKNGYIDDVNGYDFYNKSSTVKDGTGHGTHVSGIIASKHGADSVLGMAPGSKILPLRFLGSNGDGSVDAAIEAIDYAVAMGAKVINASWGGGSCSNILQKKVDSLSSHSVLFVSAAGNDGKNISFFPEYPASYNSPMQITVGAHTFDHLLAGFSNLGDLVHLTAPGANIVSSVPGGYASLNGTSMATPHVAGAAALLISAFPTASMEDIKNAVVGQIEPGPYKVKSRGALNVYKAYTYLKQNHQAIAP